MALQDQVVPLAFGIGVDTKTDRKAVTTKLTRLQDAVFTKAHSGDKRNGYTGLTTAIAGGGNISSSATMLSKFQGQLVCQDNRQLYAYSPTANAWVSQGMYVSCKAEVDEVSSSLSSQTLQDACTWNGYGIYTWTQQTAYHTSSSPTVVDTVAKYTVQDLTTGTPLASAVSLGLTVSGEYGATKTFVMNTGGTSVPATIAANATLSLYTYAISGGAVAVTATGLGITPSSVACFGLAPAVSGEPGVVRVFDAAGTATGGVLAYAAPAPSLIVKTFNTAGSVVNTFTLAATTAVGVSVCVDPTNGNIWVYYVTSSNDLKYLVLSSTLSTVLAATTIHAGSGHAVFQVTAISVSTTQQQFFYSIENGADQVSTASIPSIVYGTVTSAGTVVTTGTLVTDLDIYSKPVKYNGKTYIAAIFRSTVQGTVFILNVDGASPGVPIAKVFAGSAFSYFSKYATSSGVDPANTQWGINPCGFVTGALVLSSSKIGFLFPEVTTTNTQAGHLPGSAAAAQQSFQLTQSSVASFDFADADTYQALEANNTLVMNGGILWQYDGSSTTELGFNLYPEINKIVNGGGGSMAEGTYLYAAIYQWTDAQGNFNQSAPYELSTTLTAGQSKATLTIVTPGISLKTAPSNPSLVIFRSAVNQPLLLQLYTVDAPKTGTSITFVDTNPDTVLSGANALYTNGGVVENIGPPPGMALTLYNNRLWTIDTTNPNTAWYSKTFQPQVAISCSDLLITQVNAIGGKCVALAGMDSNLVVFEERLPLVIQGDGYNDAGTGSTLTPAQPIPSDAGCVGSKGIIVYPQGILRKTLKGIYRLDRSLSDTYWGYDVEAYNSQTITATTLLADKTQIRFLTDSGLTLVYDYFFNQWSTFTNHEGVGACIYQNEYTYLRNDGTVYQETPGYYLDAGAAIAPLAETGSLAMSSIQNFERVKIFNLLGEFAGAAALHGVQVSIAYDFDNTTFIPLDPFYFANIDHPPTYQFEGYLPFQKCDSVIIRIQEITTGDSAEYITFTDMSFVAGIKKGVNKLKAAASVG